MSNPVGAQRYGLGGGDAYYDAVKYGGYTGTREQFGRDQAEFAQNATAVAQAKEEVERNTQTVVNTAQTFTEETVPAAIQSVEEKGDTEEDRLEARTTELVQSINTAGAVQVQAVRDEGTTQTGLVSGAGTAQVEAIEQAGSDQVDAVELAGSTQVGNVNSAGTTQVGNVNSAGTTQVGNVNTAGTAQVQAVQAKGTEVLGTIPSDYTDLSDSVDSAVSALGFIVGRNIVDLDKSVIGLLGSNGVPNTNESYGTTGFIDVSDYAGETIRIGYQNNSGGITATTVPALCTYDASKTLISYINTWVNSIEITEGIAYIRFSRGIAYFDKTSQNRLGAFVGSFPTNYIDYEEHYTKIDEIQALHEEIGRVTGQTVIEHTESLSASGTRTYFFDSVIPQGTTIYVLNKSSIKATSSNFNVRLMKEDETTVDYGITYSGTAKKIVTEFDVYGISTWVNGTEWSFEIIYGYDTNSRIEDIESVIKLINKTDLTTGSYTLLTPTTDSKRIRLIDEYYKIKAGSAIVYDTKDLYINFTLYDSENNPTAIETSGWVSGVDTHIFKSDGYLVILFANAQTVEDSTWITPDDYTCNVRLFYTDTQIYVALNDSYNSVFHTFNNWNSAAVEYSNLHGDSEETESFLFFTDPHLCEGSNWQIQFKEMMGQIQQCYNSIPASFCMCGGDWLGSDDTVESARYKLGFINGTMKSLFDKQYSLVGNHDLNEQGVTKLDNKSMKNLWYRDFEQCYYTFEGQSTKFYCFNTEGEQDTLSSNNNYGYEMCKWFANALLTDNSPHIALAMHIIYITPEFTSINEIASKILDIASAYNNRTTIAVDGTTYNFSNVRGTIEFVIAGHSHADYVTTINGIPVILTENVRKAPNLGATFDLVYVDYDNNRVNLIRAGHGSTSRTVNLTS